MEKLIAFDLYRRNDAGGHVPADRISLAGHEVYRASDVEPLLQVVRQMLEAHDTGSEGNVIALLNQARSLMGG